MLPFVKKFEIFALSLATFLKCIACLTDSNLDFLTSVSIFFLFCFLFQFINQVFALHM